MRLPLLLLICLAGMSAMAQPRVPVAIIIDDLGNNLELGRQAVALPAQLTYSVLPKRPYSREIARHANAVGKEVMLHLPMQADGNRRMGPGGLRPDMDREAFSRQLRASVINVPHIAGVNNHMGSLLTRQPEAMRWLMEGLHCLGDFYFVDSRTDVRTVARQVARDAGLANAQRDVFLDNQVEPDYVRNQLQRLVAKAKRHGSAIAIGHPYPQTLAVLQEVLPGLAAQGIEVVPVSQLVEQRRNTKSWHACSSHLRTAVRNSKP